jgi:hypothetical protein
MRGQRGQKGRRKTVPDVLTDADAEEYSQYAVLQRVMSRVVDKMLHDDALRICKEQERVRQIENFHARHEAEEQLEIERASLTITMIEHNLPSCEWEDRLCIERERYSEERKGTVRGTVRIFRK